MSITIEGKYTSATVYRDGIEQYAEAQIKMLCDMEIHKDFNIEIMLDVHPGKVGPVGLAMTTVYEKGKTCLMPALIGNDIGCGITCTKIELPKRQKKSIDYDKLTKVIDMILSNAEIYNESHEMYTRTSLDSLMHDYKPHDYISNDSLFKSFGTLGNGNHFIELDSYNGELYLIVHTGSRSIGNTIYEHYMKLAHQNTPDIPYELSYISGELLENYLEDVLFARSFADSNRRVLTRRICYYMNWDYNVNGSDYCIDIIHNDALLYTDDNIDNDILIVTKGANSVLNNCRVCIPINSVDGCIIGTAYNQFSTILFTPHGSGRKIKRTDVSSIHTSNEYKKLMKNNNVVCNTFKGTLDESPFAYRGLDEILPYLHLKDYIITKPLYNYKSGDKR